VYQHVVETPRKIRVNISETMNSYRDNDVFGKSFINSGQQTKFEALDYSDFSKPKSTKSVKSQIKSHRSKNTKIQNLNSTSSFISTVDFVNRLDY
jgi:hypothetical protein